MPTITDYNKRLESLRSERTSFLDTWYDLSDFHLAHRGRFLVSDRNRGYERNSKQINNASRLSVRALAAGMMSGLTPPSRPWFRLSTGDSELDEYAAVKQWLHDVQKIMYRIFASSNLYNSLHSLYLEMGVFGTGAMGIYRDFDNVIRCETYTAGQYFLGAGEYGRIDTFYREYQITVSQVVKQFGLENCSRSVQDQYARGNLEEWVDIVHAVEPNDSDRDLRSPMAADMPFRSVYYEYGRNKRGYKGKGNESFLMESGFTEDPIVTPRWDVASGDIYASDCPGMIALGDAKTLQLGSKRMYQAIDKSVSPPLQGPASLKNKVNGNHLGANEIVWVGETGQGLKSIYDSSYRPDINDIRQANNEAEARIREAFFADLFLALNREEGGVRTATEVLENKSEALLQLGPMLERSITEVLDPVIDRTFNIAQEAGIFPPAPDELQGKEISVEYVSVLAQAQQAVSLDGIQNVTGFAASLAGVWPEARHKVDAMQAVDDMATALGTDPKLVRSDEEAQQLLQQEQQAAAAAQQMETMAQMANVAKTASDADTGGDNLLTQTAQRVQGGQ